MEIVKYIRGLNICTSPRAAVRYNNLSERDK